LLRNPRSTLSRAPRSAALPSTFRSPLLSSSPRSASRLAAERSCSGGTDEPRMSAAPCGGVGASKLGSGGTELVRGRGGGDARGREASASGGAELLLPGRLRCVSAPWRRSFAGLFGSVAWSDRLLLSTRS